MPAPKPVIYLRNVFRIKPDREIDFLRAKEKLLRRTAGPWKLIAACGQWPLSLEQEPIEESFPVTQIWKLHDWNTLYDSMYEFSESSWYRALGDTLVTEQQELLVSVTNEPEPPIRWASDNGPGYSYLYEDVLPGDGNTHAYLRQLNWFAAQVASTYNWKLVWAATQLTAGPGRICLLWKTPDVNNIEQTLHAVSNDRADTTRYRSMMKLLANTSRSCFYPIYTERLAERIAGGAVEPIV